MDVPIPAGRWHAAVFERRSRRSFLRGAPPEPADMDRFDAHCRGFRPFPDARVELVRASPEGLFTGLIGSYGRITGASAHFAVIGRSASPEDAVRAGYIGEAAILEATALGLATCWVAGMFRHESAAAGLDLRPDETIFAVSPLGRTAGAYSAKEHLYSRFIRSKSRKDLDSLILSGTPNDWQRTALEAARLAPSAVNRQPWRFVLAERSITVRIDKAEDRAKVPRRLDCGIAMLHIEVGARAAGAAGRWSYLPLPDVARYDV